MLDNFKSKCEERSKRYLGIIFWIFTVIGSVIIFTLDLNIGLLIIVIIAALILTWGIVPSVVKILTGRKFGVFIFEKTKSNEINKIDIDNISFTAALEIYNTKNIFYERVLSRAYWQTWLSFTPTEFEEAVGDMFLDKGYRVWTTKASGDHGVDLYLEKDDKKYVVQCKTYKKALGPNAARDLYGTMVAEGANEAFLAAPYGFSAATKEFCKGKPIKLLDIDDLTKMTYKFEHYTDYELENAKSMDDVVKYVSKSLGRKIYLGKRY